jgi:hypothetical protein
VRPAHLPSKGLLPIAVYQRIHRHEKKMFSRKSLIENTDGSLDLSFVEMLTITFEIFSSMTLDKSCTSKYWRQKGKVVWQTTKSRPNSSGTPTKFLNKVNESPSMEN